MQRLIAVFAGVLTFVALLLALAVFAHAQSFQVSSGLAIQTVAINVSTATTTTLVAAVALQTINVYGMELYCNGTQSITMLDSVPTTLVPIQAIGPGGVIRDLRFWPWFSTTKGAGLTMTTSAAVQCSGNLYYTQG